MTLEDSKRSEAKDASPNDGQAPEGASGSTSETDPQVPLVEGEPCVSPGEAGNGLGKLTSYRPRAKSVAEVETDDRWGDSEIDAALGPLDVGVASSPNVGASLSALDTVETEDATRFFDRPLASPPLGSDEETKQPSREKLPSTDEEATQYYDRASLGLASDKPTPFTDEDAATQYYDRAALGLSPSQPAPSVEKEDATLHYDRAALGLPSSKPPASSAVEIPKQLTPPRPEGAAKTSTSTTDARANEARVASSGPTRLVVEGVSHPRDTLSVSGAKAGAAEAVGLSSAAPVAEAGGAVAAPPASEAEPMNELSNDLPAQDAEAPAAPGLTGVTAFSIAPRPGTPGFEEEAWLDPFFVRARRRALRSLACSVTVVLGLSAVDAGFAARAAADHPAWWRLFLASVGLSVPTAIVVALVVATGSMLLHPDSSPSLRRLLDRLRPIDIRRQTRLAVILLTAPLAIAVWLLLVARAALPVLGTVGSDHALGFVLAALAFGLAMLIAVPVLAVARYVGVRLRQKPPDPLRFGLVGLALGVMPIALAIATGETSGAGGAFGIWGVFKRPELDLRLPVLLLILTAAAYFGQSVLRRVSPVVMILVTLLPLGLTYRAATKSLQVRAVSLAIERGAPLGRLTLGGFRKLTDRDHDGFSARFGGGDCNDHDKTINPGADDVPQNGIDEDCSGRDAEPVLLKSVPSTPREVLAERRALIPTDLNVIVISIDTLRADVLGHERHIVPHLDALAEGGVVFENAYAPASYTGKSVGPLFIGKHSSETNRDFSHFNAFAEGKDVFVQQRLQAAGIRTISAQGYWYFYQPPYGFEQGFDVIDSSAASGTGYVEGDRTSTSERLADAVLTQLGKPENQSQRFYLWTHFTDPHVEYVAHEGFDFGASSKERYYGEAAFVDHHVGRIIDWVRSQPWGKKTAFIVTSDHGEAFGEHGMIRHGFELWEPLVKVPFIVVVPGLAPRRVVVRRSIIDLVPTLIDLMQAKAPTGTNADFVSGQSLLPELLGIEGADAVRPVFMDMAGGPFNAERQAYINGDLKLIASEGRPLGLFDLAKDPEEKKDLLDDESLKERVVGEFRAFKKSMRVVDVKGKTR